MRSTELFNQPPVLLLLLLLLLLLTGCCGCDETRWQRQQKRHRGWHPIAFTPCEQLSQPVVQLQQLSARPYPLRLYVGSGASRLRLRYRLRLLEDLPVSDGPIGFRLRLAPGNPSSCSLLSAAVKLLAMLLKPLSVGNSTNSIETSVSGLHLADLCAWSRLSVQNVLDEVKQQRFCRRRRRQLIPHLYHVQVPCLCGLRSGLYRQRSVPTYLPALPKMFSSCVSSGGYQATMSMTQQLLGNNGTRTERLLGCYNISFQLRVRNRH